MNISVRRYSQRTINNMQSRFDWITRGQTEGPNSNCDIDLVPGRSFAVVPSLGSLCPGWVLAVPRKPLLSIRQLNSGERTAFLGFCQAVGQTLSHFHPHSHYFEHGPSQEKSAVGCGVDQAHVHIVPTPVRLLDEVLTDWTVNWIEVDNLDPWAAVPAEAEYYLIANSTRSYVGTPSKPESQYFRKKLAALSGIPNEWDYREWPHYDHVKRTIDHFTVERLDQAA
jgi:ATP adenylyltransferase